mgnify:CR=1 FL=1
MQPSVWQILIVAALVLILFGRGRISEMMGDVGKGIRSFKKGITEEEANTANPAPKIEGKTGDVSGENTKGRSVMANFRTGLDAMVREAELQEMEKKWAAENDRIMQEHPALPDGSGGEEPMMEPLESPSSDRAEPSADVDDRPNLPPADDSKP